jgi:photosystem II stability/assembly factor-like uncharacterized protein
MPHFRRTARSLPLLAILLALACGRDPTPPRAVLTPQASGTTARLQAISAVSAEVAWASGVEGTYTRTLDGGRTWRSGVVPGADTLQFRDVHAVAADTAYLLSAGVGPLSRIYKTTDGGVSWTTQFVNDVPEAFFDCFAFWDATHGVAFSDAVEGQFVVAVTEDGERWGAADQGALPAAQPGEGGFAASGTCVLVRGREDGWIGTGNAAPARVLRTADRGRTWSAAEVPLAAGDAAGVTSLAFWDAAVGIAVGGAIGDSESRQRRVARSEDGGRSWTAGGEPSFRGAVYGAAYVPASAPPAVVAVGPGGADYSTDHGRTWIPLDTLAYWSVGFAGPEAGWLVGPEGRIVKVAFSK